MHSILRLAGAAIALALVTTAVSSAGTFVCPVTRPDPNPPCPQFNPDNGHYYAMSAPHEGLTWHEAKAGAESFTFRGAAGYLATITSEQEYQFLIDHHFRNHPYWIGASDAEVEGEWRWVVGPEAGTLFWKGGPDGIETTYAGWANGEPNNLGGDDTFGGEDYAAFWLADHTMGWNDVANDAPSDFARGYLVEFSPVPEPGSYALGMTSLLAIVGVLVAKRIVVPGASSAIGASIPDYASCSK
jgi:hypothetical protein